MTSPICAVAAFVFEPVGVDVVLERAGAPGRPRERRTDRRILVVQRANPPSEGQWSIPGGKVQPLETLAQAVAREVAEETGLVVEIGPLACVVERIGDGFHYVILDYLARVVGGMLSPGSDARAARFVSRDELAALPHTDGLLEMLARAEAIAWR